jgi:hypothetical protein
MHPPLGVAIPVPSSGPDLASLPWVGAMVEEPNTQSKLPEYNIYFIMSNLCKVWNPKIFLGFENFLYVLMRIFQAHLAM